MYLDLVSYFISSGNKSQCHIEQDSQNIWPMEPRKALYSHPEGTTGGHCITGEGQSGGQGRNFWLWNIPD